jgi:hypothetical protein
VDAWQGNYPIDIEDLAPFDFEILCFVIGVGEEFADRGDAGPAMGPVDDLIGVETVLPRPRGPNTHYGWRRVDQDSIHVK